jgi:hypothetical protein
MFNKSTSEAGLVNKSSLLAKALGMTKFKTIIAITWSHFVVLLRSDLDVQQTFLMKSFRCDQIYNNLSCDLAKPNSAA